MPWDGCEPVTSPAQSTTGKFATYTPSQVIPSTTPAPVLKRKGRPPGSTNKGKTKSNPAKSKNPSAKKNIPIIKTSNEIQDWRKLVGQWPSNNSIPTALEYPGICFYGNKFVNGITEIKTKFNFIPVYSGANALVYKIKLENETYAIKCFTQKPHGYDNQKRISEYLKEKNLDFIMIYDTTNTIIVVHENKHISCPILVTQWVSGSTLQNYLNEKPLTQISTIAKNFLSMISQMENSKIAHGDLQSKNIMIQTDHSLKLIDYDGMYIPELKGKYREEFGLKDYQHPLIKTNKFLNETMDRFSVIVIYLSLLVLSMNPDWYKKYHDEYNIIFREKDFINPAESQLFKDISQIHNSEIKKLNTELKKYCNSKEFNNFKTIDEILA